ncbi:hypothetical protein KC968_02940 [Candidatus Saccharibacteria bacterium]|nr:hypothetical protein [Candidatus Saccharibacteria bacterium]
MSKVVNNYSEFVEEYMAIFEPLFEKAFEVSEFNLIMTMLAVRGVSDDGWNPFENTEDTFEEVYKQQNKFRGSLGFNINLWMYLHLIECSEHYEIIANLINTIKGKDYLIANHKNKKFANLKVEQKIDRLKSIARGTDFENVSQPFEKTFDKRFRNAIGHGDYAIKSSDRAGVTIVDDEGFPTIYELQKANDLINRSVALHVAIRSLLKHYRSHYKESIKIQSSPGFGGGKPIEVTLIVRKKYGVIGFRCIGGYDAGVPFETRVSMCLPYEMKLIEKGENNLPASKINKANNILKFIPKKIAPKVARKLRKIYGIDVR